MSEHLVKVEMIYERADGSRYRRTIEGEEVAQWKEWTDGVCALAAVRGCNPDWRSIQWTQEEIDASQLESERR